MSLFQGQQSHSVDVTDTAQAIEVIKETSSYMIINPSDGEDILIKWGDDTVEADNTLTGNDYPVGNVYIPAGSYQVLRKNVTQDYFSVITATGTATIKVIVGTGS
ncbi:MAG: hypothetical protein U9O94_00710 [Nanoarchaeota archaeon]|nr:hypothetical protein [Nanoarchaeota archaeon]